MPFTTTLVIPCKKKVNVVIDAPSPTSSNSGSIFHNDSMPHACQSQNRIRAIKNKQDHSNGHTKRKSKYKRKEYIQSAVNGGCALDQIWNCVVCVVLASKSCLTNSEIPISVFFVLMIQLCNLCCPCQEILSDKFWDSHLCFLCPHDSQCGPKNFKTEGLSPGTFEVERLYEIMLQEIVLHFSMVSCQLGKQQNKSIRLFLALFDVAAKKGQF